jgi:hypothetical protein
MTLEIICGGSTFKGANCLIDFFFLRIMSLFALSAHKVRCFSATLSLKYLPQSSHKILSSRLRLSYYKLFASELAPMALRT